MKIGIYDPYLDTLSGGEKYMLSIATCLASSHEVFLFWDTQEKRIREKSLEKLGIDLSRIKFAKNIFSPKVSLFSRLKTSAQYDKIIYLSDGSTPLVLSKLYIHFQFPVEWVNGKSLKTRFKLKRVKKIFCNSFFTKAYIDRKFNIDSQVLYPPVEIKNNKTKKENVILHAGRFGMSIEGTNYKKQDIMVQAFKKMVDSGLKDWRFVLLISVRDEDIDKIKELKIIAKNYPIDIFENVSNPVLWSYYSKAKLYWHATGFGENLGKHPERAEHFGISTVEAMESGVIPVVINAGGQKEIVENEKSGFLWNTTDELISRTLKLVNDINLWRKISEASVERSKIFSGDRFCKELEQIIEK